MFCNPFFYQRKQLWFLVALGAWITERIVLRRRCEYAKRFSSPGTQINVFATHAAKRA
jgi:hypothetical protein